MSETTGGRDKLPFGSHESFETADPYFERLLEYAFERPQIVSLDGDRGIAPEEVQEREQYYGSQRELPDDSPLFISSYQPVESEVPTTDPDKFALLIAQALWRLAITNGEPDPGVRITPGVRKQADHEVAHGRMGELFGVRSAYIVRVLYDPRKNLWAIGPGHALLGPTYITKLESAAINVAPEDASEGDLLSVRAAGYASREEVLRRLYATHPHIHPDNLRQ